MNPHKIDRPNLVKIILNNIFYYSQVNKRQDWEL